MPIHNSLTGLELHQPYHYIQEADPGAVGGGKFWLKVSTATVSRRNDANAAWVTMGSNGTLTSVGMTVPSFLSVAGSPITGAGTLAVTLANQSANFALLGPTSGGAATPAFRALVANDVPTMVGDSGSGGTKGAVPAPAAGDAAAGKFLKADGTFAIPPGTSVSPLTTKGDLFGFSTVNDRLPVGANDKILIADSTQALGVRWGDSGTPTWLINNPDIPPVSPNAQDDEFTDPATLPGGGSALWTWRNQGSASVTMSAGTLRLVAPPLTGVSNKLLLMTPPAPPWSFACKVGALHGFLSFPKIGMVVSNAGTVKSYILCVGADGADKIALYNFTSDTAFNASLTAFAFALKVIYLKIEDDNTNLNFYFSVDGYVYQLIATQARTTFLGGTPDRIGLTAASENNGSLSTATGIYQWWRRMS